MNDNIELVVSCGKMSEKYAKEHCEYLEKLNGCKYEYSIWKYGMYAVYKKKILQLNLPF